MEEKKVKCDRKFWSVDLFWISFSLFLENIINVIVWFHENLLLISTSHQWDIQVHGIKDRRGEQTLLCELGQCLQMMWSHHIIRRYKLAEWREWRGLMEWPPTWHHAVLSHAGTWQALFCWIRVTDTQTWHPPAAVPSHLMPRRCLNTQSHKRAKRGLNQAYLHLPTGGGMCHIVSAKK